MKNPTLPPGANSATAISIAIPSPTAAIEEVLVRWHKASVPQSLDGYYASPGREWVDWRHLRARGFRNKNVDTKRESLSNPGMKEPTHIIIQNSMPAHSGMAVKHPVHGRLILVKRAGGDAWHCRKRDDTSGNLTILRPKDWKPDFGE